MYNSYYSKSDNDSSKLTLYLILCIMAIIILSASGRACSRASSDMILIEKGYCYDKNTMIIYKESKTGYYDNDTVYTVYYNEDGYVCKYNIKTYEWEAIIK